MGDTCSSHQQCMVKLLVKLARNHQTALARLGLEAGSSSEILWYMKWVKMLKGAMIEQRIVF
jgi:hypothetical protein